MKHGIALAMVLRFNAQGHVIEGPAVYPLKLEET